ncbi:unnamed protein product [Strongylus vulgaris]|uniref:Uncharacterized protein n=1 Tax=Strongylus vulgaris TaxID=40348 RepID=A0A3P7LKU5_STRVU|nr:unnamed protein product [Strongylus vulgaris]
MRTRGEPSRTRRRRRNALVIAARTTKTAHCGCRSAANGKTAALAISSDSREQRAAASGR